MVSSFYGTWSLEGISDRQLRRVLLDRIDDLWRRTYWHHTTAGQPVNVAIDNANQAANAYGQIAQFMCTVDNMGRGDD